jgi:Spy/CpxP family protein refolding chaperone
MRITRFAVPFLSLALAMAISLAAGAQTPPSQQPSQSAPQTTPAPPPSEQPSAPSANQNSAQPQANEDNPLNLTDEQKAKLRPIIMGENQQMEALRNDTSMTQDQKIAKANQIRADASPKIKAILTPDQLQKLAELQQERAHQQQQQQPQSQPAPPANSQPPQK